ncbi:interferon alpha-inducible protein 27, mitochondrial-like isoform X1 [Pteronotus mesoamericanus]|uniref:interferon alpha-inducible protein 27, mitochondrial-like isoform X1 n=1 Tax=Pteronotus mesoamericanus TaxID=1884717 RepID=UPI0023EC8166|nr:interferon alpha-inducible protein 27, mitochondrial-like isoform X1 [Pteronotus parnellii mesoamericanus]XP_054422939.1 interferon alpha-inducible protein 27, mitochondrial-like isoform X1 [Pteronotus parnellii mesoamericanus]XP_054422940.1 interferon alpha-inducible protein 27, mitochondrial-like isoform X1 [Pteronotus parnellii mesoamericanus]XP_054422941.1 interferon alpha-inducible protein 27, mitochondrial-like isoform X1 [Pteronotus parnellii mesoamericanus]
MEAVLASTLTKVMSSVSLAKAGAAAASSGVLSGLIPAGLTLPSIDALSSAASSVGSLLETLGSPDVALTDCPLGAKTVAVVIGGAVAVGAVPVALGTIGFTGAGIAASSLAAQMMSSAAIANGGGVAAGSLVATLQSVGAAGLSISSKIILGSAGSALTYFLV